MVGAEKRHRHDHIGPGPFPDPAAPTFRRSARPDKMSALVANSEVCSRHEPLPHGNPETIADASVCALVPDQPVSTLIGGGAVPMATCTRPTRAPGAPPPACLLATQGTLFYTSGSEPADSRSGSTGCIV
jgi:hypothetical protein